MKYLSKDFIYITSGTSLGYVETKLVRISYFVVNLLLN